MSLKAELETWAAALKAYDEEDFEKALDLFSRIADSSKILTNMGLIYATLGEHEAAVEQFYAATQLDQYLAVAYFQSGVSNFLLGRYELALRDFDEALLYLRGNQAINYEQLGLKFRLYSAEVLFNKGLSHIYLGNTEQGLRDMRDAQADKQTAEHNVIDDAMRDRGEGYTVFSIPVGILYRPSENKLKNAKTKDYMGKARLVAATDASEAYTEFTGVTRLQRGYTPTGAPILDRPNSDPAGLGRSATVPAPRNPVNDIDVPRISNLERSKTSIGVRSERAMSPAVSAGPGASLSRSATSVRSAPNMGLGPTRALSVRKPGPGGPGADRERPPPPPEKAGPGANTPRLTEIYDDYIGGYGDGGDVPPLPSQNAAQPPPSQRVAQWAKSNANPAMSPSRAPSTRAASAYGGSSSGSMRRKPTRRGTLSRGPSARAMSAYEEEEEGYVSGEYDDQPYELSKIRVKLHYQDDVRGIVVTPDISFEEFLDRVSVKFGKRVGELGMKFRDEDGGRVTLRDESDFEMAIEVAREVAGNAKGRGEGKLEVWCTDQ